MPLPAGTATGLSGDFSQREHIDHMLFSRGALELLPDGAEPKPSVRLEKEPRSPWDAAREVVGASDHVWIAIRLRVRLAADGGACDAVGAAAAPDALAS